MPVRRLTRVTGLGRRAAVALATIALLAGPALALPGAAVAAGGKSHASGSGAGSGSSAGSGSGSGSGGGSANGGQSLLSTSTPALGGGITAPGETTPTTNPTVTAANSTASSGGGGLSSGTAIGVAIVAVVIIGGIVFAIFRDARRRAPTRRAASGPKERIPGSQRPPKARKLSPAERRRRKRGRAQRR